MGLSQCRKCDFDDILLKEMKAAILSVCIIAIAVLIVIQFCHSIQRDVNL